MRGKKLDDKTEVCIKNSKVDQKTLREHYFKGQYSQYKCSICNQEPFWNHKELTLILDHINGQNHDDRLENLRWVCPNCNQQLETTGSKNLIYQKQLKNKTIKIKYSTICKECGIQINEKTKSGLCLKCSHKLQYVTEHPDRETLKKLIRTLPFTKIAEKYKVSDTAIKKWCKSENLPATKKEINSYSDLDWNKI